MNDPRNLKGPIFGASTPFAKALLGAVEPWLMAGLLYPDAHRRHGCEPDGEQAA